VVLFYRYLTARLFSFISSLFNVAVCFCLCYPCLMLRYVLCISSLFNVALCCVEFSHRLNVTLVRLN
jgi:hypothetical protein